MKTWFEVNGCKVDNVHDAIDKAETLLMINETVTVMRVTKDIFGTTKIEDVTEKVLNFIA